MANGRPACEMEEPDKGEAEDDNEQCPPTGSAKSATSRLFLRGGSDGKAFTSDSPTLCRPYGSRTLWIGISETLTLNG